MQHVLPSAKVMSLEGQLQLANPRPVSEECMQEAARLQRRVTGVVVGHAVHQQQGLVDLVGAVAGRHACVEVGRFPERALLVLKACGVRLQASLAASPSPTFGTVGSRRGAWPSSATRWAKTP
jgi:hypothetical protein